MITEASSAWVIHKRWSGDTSAQVVFFTQNEGLISCLYRGGRAPKKQALLQAFLPLWLSFDARRDWNYVRSLESAASALSFARKNVLTGLYVNELLHHTLRPMDPHAKLFISYTKTLHALSAATHPHEIEAILRRFERMLLQALGYEISLKTVAHTLTPIAREGYYRFIAGEGLVEDCEGILGADILAFANDELTDISVLRAAKHIMRRAIEYGLDGKPLKSRECYRQ